MSQQDSTEDIGERVSELETEVQEIRSEYLKPSVVSRVLTEAGLSTEKAESLVETMQQVEEGLDDE